MSSTFTNEPSGTSVLLDWPFNTPAGSGLIDSYGTGRVVADATAPVSPSNVLQQRMPAGSNSGAAQMDFYPNNPTGVGDIFVGIMWKVLPGFQGLLVNTNKIFFCINGQANGFLAWYGPTNEPKSLMWNNQNSGVLDNGHVSGSWGDSPGGRFFTSNIRSGIVSIGDWHKVEFYWKKSTTNSSRDGIVRWWLDGALCGNYTNINNGSSNVNWYSMNHTWDGSFAPFSTDHTYHFDHLYISTGGTVTPSPSLPTISSFTPTSGPVGTPITIVGTNFDPSPAGNAITLNGVPCQTLGAVSTQLNTAVPNSGTSGAIRVTTSAGSVLSSNSFTVTVPSPGGGDGGGTGGGAGTTTYTYTADFSGTQGPRWYYLNENGTQMTYSAGSQLWNGEQLYQGIWNGGFHPGVSSAAVLKFVVPGTGSVHITGNFADLDVVGGNGVICTVKKNGSTTVAGPYAIANGDTTGQSYNVTNSVTAGDYFTFEVNGAGENVYDSTSLNPVIVYTPQSQSEEVITLTLTSMTLTEGTTGTITLTITPTRNTESIVTFTSSSDSIVVPGTISIPANAGSTAVQVLAGTPGSATITATLGASSTTSTVISTAAPDPGDPPPVSPTLSAYTDFLLTYRWF